MRIADPYFQSICYRQRLAIQSVVNRGRNMRQLLRASVRFVVIVAGLGIGFGIHAAPPLIWNPSDVYRETYPADGAELGRGWYQNEVTAAPGGCIKGVEIPLLSSDLAYSFSEVTSREQVFKALHVNASASYGAAKATASFADNYNFDRSSVAVLATVDVRKFGSYWGPPKGGRLEFDLNALAALKAASSKGEVARAQALYAFFARCGDSYVSAIEYGASYASQFTIAATSTVRATLIGAGASGGFGRFKASISISKDAGSVLVGDNVRVKTSQTGGTYDVPGTSQAAYARISDFAKTVTKDNVVPLTIVLRPYESHPDFPAEYQGMRTSPQTVSHLLGACRT